MKIYKALLTILLLFDLNSFGQIETTVVKIDHYKTKKFDVAIFPTSYIDVFPRKSFTPTRKDIAKAEIALRTELKELNKRQINQQTTPIIHKNLNKYKRQYFGIFDKNGNRILLINSFWGNAEETKEKWLKDKIYVLDGGSFYWNIKFNLDTDKLFDLQINGYG